LFPISPPAFPVPAFIVPLKCVLLNVDSEVCPISPPVFSLPFMLPEKEELVTVMLYPCPISPPIIECPVTFPVMWMFDIVAFSTYPNSPW